MDIVAESAGEKAFHAEGLEFKPMTYRIDTCPYLAWCLALLEWGKDCLELSIRRMWVSLKVGRGARGLSPRRTALSSCNECKLSQVATHLIDSRQNRDNYFSEEYLIIGIIHFSCALFSILFENLAHLCLFLYFYQPSLLSLWKVFFDLNWVLISTGKHA